MDEDLVDDYEPEKCIEHVEYTIEILEDFVKHMKQKAQDK